MALTPPPEAPSPLDPGTFAKKMDAKVAWDALHVAEMNVAIPLINAAVVSTSQNVIDAAAQASNAASAATSASLAAGVTKWVAGNYTQGVNVYSPITGLTYRRLTVGTTASATDPSLDAVGWTCLTSTITAGGFYSTGVIALSSTSPSAQYMNPLAFGQYVRLPNAMTMQKSGVCFTIFNGGEFPLRVHNFSDVLLGFLAPNTCCVVGLADNANSNGIWNISNLVPYGVTSEMNVGPANWGSLATFAKVAIDSDRTMLFLISTGGIAAFIYTASTKTFGARQLITPDVVAASLTMFKTVLFSPTQVLLTCTTLALPGNVKAICIPFSGDTVGAATSSSLSMGSTIALMKDLIVTSTWAAVLINLSTSSYLIPITIPSGTPVIGATPVGLPSASSSFGLQSISSLPGVVVATSCDGANVFADGFLMSGTSTPVLSTSSRVTLPANLPNTGFFSFLKLSSPYLAIIYRNSNNDVGCSVLTVTGAGALTANTLFISGNYAMQTDSDCVVIGNQILLSHICNGENSVKFNLITNTAGVVSKGTELSLPTPTRPYQVTFLKQLSTDYHFVYYTSYLLTKVAITIASGSPLLSANCPFHNVACSSSAMLIANNSYEGERVNGLASAKTVYLPFRSSGSGYQSSQVYSISQYSTKVEPVHLNSLLSTGNSMFYDGTNIAWAFTQPTVGLGYIIQRIECAA